INCGVDVMPDGSLATTDAIDVDMGRLAYWPDSIPEVHLRFDELAADPLPILDALLRALKLWGAAAWNSEALDRRAATEGWTKAMRDQANRGAIAFDGEARKMAAGVDALRKDQRLLEAFVAMNRAMSHAAAGRYESWRAFQIGFILASLPAL